MEFIKKNLDCILYGAAALFSALIFATFAGNAVKATSGSFTISATCYGLMEDIPMYVVTFILSILVFLGSAALIVLKLMKKELSFANFIALGLAVIALVVCIFFFCFAGFYNANSLGGMKLGGGAVISAIFMMFAFFALAFAGAKKYIIK